MNSGRTVSTAVSILLMVLIAGCAAPGPSAGRSPYAGMAKSAPLGSAAALTPETARVHVNRPSAFFGITALTPVRFNGRKVGTLSSGSSLDHFVTPGYLQISGDYRVRPFDLVVQGGHEYRIDVLLKGGRFELVSDRLVVSPPEPAPAAVTQARPAGGSWDGGPPSQAESGAVQTSGPASPEGVVAGGQAVSAEQAETPPPAIRTGTGELRGEVVGVDGRVVRIAMEPGTRAAVGDTVRFGQKVAGFEEMIFMSGEWTVTEITVDVTLAEPGAGTEGTPGRGYVALIRPPNP